MAERCVGALQVSQPRAPHADADWLPARVVPVYGGRRRGASVQLVPRPNCTGMGRQRWSLMAKPGTGAQGSDAGEPRMQGLQRMRGLQSMQPALPVPLRYSCVQAATSCCHSARRAAAPWKRRRVSLSLMLEPTLRAPAGRRAGIVQCT